MTNLYHINGKNIVSAIVSCLLMMVTAIFTYIISVGNIFHIDYTAMANIGVISLLTGVVSLSKSFFTDNNGNFAGIVPVTDSAKINPVPPVTGGAQTDIQG